MHTMHMSNKDFANVLEVDPRIVCSPNLEQGAFGAVNHYLFIGQKRTLLRVRRTHTSAGYDEHVILPAHSS